MRVADNLSPPISSFSVNGSTVSMVGQSRSIRQRGEIDTLGIAFGRWDNDKTLNVMVVKLM